MGKKRGMVKIDADKLKRAFESRSLHSSVVAQELGYNGSYFSNAIMRGSLAPAGVNALEKIYGIPLSEYEYEEPLPWEEPELTIPDDGLRYEPVTSGTITVKLDEAQLELIMIDLQNMIRSAIYSEVKRAWNE